MSENEHDFLKNRFSSFGNESNSTICWKVCFLNSLTHHRVMFFMQIISKTNVFSLLRYLIQGLQINGRA